MATWVSSAIVTRSRNRRVVRVATTRRSQVKVADAAIAASVANNMAATLPATSASAIRLSHRANNASGTAWSKVSVTTTTTSRGSWVYPSLHSRHIDESAGGGSS